ncbi:MAG: hypothetical protein ACI9NQ_000514 [Paracoccaceae bacterium]|jgi:hypothetical protein
MKTTIDLPDSLFRKAKVHAATNGISLKTFVTRAIEQSLHPPQKSLAEKLAELPTVPPETLRTVSERVLHSDAIDLKLQQKSEK